jgi:hypothetical protein
MNIEDHVPGPVAVNANRMSAEIILATGREDRSGDVLVVNGIDLSEHRQNPVGLLNHDRKLPVGFFETPAGSYTVEKRHNALVGELFFSRGRLGSQTFAAVEARALRGASVGFLTVPGAFAALPSGGKLYVKTRLVEGSIVAIPDNVDAAVTKIHKALKGELICKGLRTAIEAADADREAWDELMGRRITDREWLEWKAYTAKAARRVKPRRTVLFCR